MRISTLLTLCTPVFLSTSVAAAPFNPSAAVNSLRKAAAHFVTKAPEAPAYKGFKAPENKSEWKPLQIKTFGWGGESWEPEDSYVYTYDKAGNIIKEEATDYEQTVVVTESEYNENNNLVSSLSVISEDGADFHNNRKLLRSYDPVLTDFITLNSEWLWIEEDAEW